MGSPTSWVCPLTSFGPFEALMCFPGRAIVEAIPACAGLSNYHDEPPEGFPVHPRVRGALQ